MIDKSDRFVTVDTQFDGYGYSLLIGDYNWWFLNNLIIEDWAKLTMSTGYERKGMVIKFATAEDRLQFLMRWSE
jgi:hypothetical protein